MSLGSIGHNLMVRTSKHSIGQALLSNRLHGNAWETHGNFHHEQQVCFELNVIQHFLLTAQIYNILQHFQSLCFFNFKTADGRLTHFELLSTITASPPHPELLLLSSRQIA